MDISWLTPAQVSPHYFNAHCEGSPLGPIVRGREGEEEGGRGREHTSFIPTKELPPPPPTHTVNRWDQGIIIQLRLLTVNNAQRFNAHKRRIIGNRMPGDF